MSQYMNRAPRTKGWKAIDQRLESWADNFNAQLIIQTEIVEFLKSDSIQTIKCLPECILPEKENETFHEPNPDVLGWSPGVSEVGSSYLSDDSLLSSTWTEEDYCFNPVF